MAGSLKCSICKRPLDVADDPLSVDCGGDCYGCIVAAEDGQPAPDLPLDELRAWCEARDARMDAMWADALFAPDQTEKFRR